MTEPKRWLDDPSVPSSLRGVLAMGAREVDFPDGVRSRVAARLAVATASSFAIAGVAQAAKAATGTGVGVAAGGTTLAGLKLTGLVVSLTLGAAATTVVVEETTSTKVAMVEAPIAEVFVEGVRVNERQMLLPSDALELRPVGELPWTVDDLPLAAPGVPSARVAAPHQAPPPRSLPSANADFEREVNTLREARHLLHGSPAEALARLDAHGRRFPRGQLVAERQLLQMQALSALGRQSEAVAIGERLLQSESARLYHERVKRLLGKITTTPKDREPEPHSRTGRTNKDGFDDSN